jgi:hypothetical protein
LVTGGGLGFDFSGRLNRDAARVDAGGLVEDGFLGEGEMR